MANSVIIFDEAQMIPNQYLKPCIAAMEQLLRHYGSTLVLCTATQPALETLFSKDIHITELCPRMEEQFAFFKRARVEEIGKLSADALADRLKKETCALCILNTKKMTQHLYEMLKGDGVYHLSTSMYPRHRKQVLKEIRRQLRTGKKCVVLSTSLVEAGVDLDFETVYRQLAGIDSIIQAAGRCNREGKRHMEDCYTYVFQLEEKEYMPGQRQQMDVAKSLMLEGKQLDALDTIHDYFAQLYYYKRDSLDQKEILKMFQPGQFGFATAAKAFRLIESDTVALLIQREERAKQLAEELIVKGATRKRIREAGLYSVSIYRQQLEPFLAAGMAKAISSDIDDFYILTNMEQYKEDTGLNMTFGLGEAVIL